MNKVHIIRDAIGRVVSMLTMQRIKVTQRGMQAAVAYDKRTGEIMHVNIPYLPDDASDEFIAAVQGFLDHEVGHVLFSDSQVLRDAHKGGKRLANMANLVEDVYVETRMAKQFAGSGFNLQNTSRFHLERMLRPAITKALVEGDTKTALGNVAIAAFRAWGGQSAAVDFLKSDPQIADMAKELSDRVGPDLVDRMSKIKSSADALDLAKQVLGKLKEQNPPAPPSPAPQQPPPPQPQEEEEEPDDSDEDEGDGQAPGVPEPEPEPEEQPSGAEPPPPEPGEPPPGTENEPEEQPAQPEAGEPDEEPEGDDAPAAGGAEPPNGEEGEPDEPEDGDDDAPPATGGGAGEEDEGEEEDPEPQASAAGGGDGEDEDENAAGTGEPDDGEPPGEGGAAPEENPHQTGLDDAFEEERDYDEQVSQALTIEAGEQSKGADYIVFSTEWDLCQLAKESKRPDAIEELAEQTRHMVAGMQKQLERALMSRERRGWNPGQRKGKLNPGALYKAMTGDDRLFRNRYEVRGKLTAVSLAMDCSGSMNGHKIKTAGVAAFAICEILERLKMIYEASGFTTDDCSEMESAIRAEQSALRESPNYSRHESLYLPIFKEFGGRFDARAKARLATLCDSTQSQQAAGLLQCNVDGESIALAAHRLMQQPAERRVLLVFSDGQPATMPGYGVRDHLKRTVKDIESSGIDVVGIGIQSEAVKDYYSKSVVLSDASDLPTTVMAQLTSLLLAS